MQVIKKNFKLYILQLLYLERIQLQYFANAYYRIIRCTTNTSVKQRHKRAVWYIRFHCKLAKQISLGISRISLRSNKTRRKANKTAQVFFRTLGQRQDFFNLYFNIYYSSFSASKQLRMKIICETEIITLRNIVFSSVLVMPILSTVSLRPQI